MAYQTNIPQATDLISASQSAILGNFQFLGDTTGNVANGFYKLPNGLIINWGEITTIKTGLGIAGSNSVTFAQIYSTAVYSVVITEVKNSISSSNVLHLQTEAGLSGFTILAFGGTAPNFDTKAYWLAIGV